MNENALFEEIILDGDGKIIGSKPISPEEEAELNEVLERAVREGSSENIAVFDDDFNEVPPKS